MSSIAFRITLLALSVHFSFSSYDSNYFFNSNSRHFYTHHSPHAFIRTSFLLLAILILYIYAEKNSTLNSDTRNQTYYELLGCETQDCSPQEIKKKYRKLALSLHPDKRRDRADGEYKHKDDSTSFDEETFIALKHAYETLIDPERRLQYDLSLQGLTYELMRREETDRYRNRPFHMYMTKKKKRDISNTSSEGLKEGKVFSALLAIDFSYPVIQDINLEVQVSIADIFDDQELERKFYRKIRCPHCGGSGSSTGQCRRCSLCDGRGGTWHFFERGEYWQGTETTCGACNGRGCIPEGSEQCSHCWGKGTVMDESSIRFTIPKGFHSGYQKFYPDVGHESSQGLKGGVMVTAKHKVIEGWRMTATGNLATEIKVSTDSIKEGFAEDVVLPWGEVTMVTVKPSQVLESLLEGVKLLEEGLGLLREDGTRSDLEIEVTADNLKNMSGKSFISLVQTAGISEEDPTYTRLMRIFYFGNTRELERVQSTGETDGSERSAEGMNEKGNAKSSGKGYHRTNQAGGLGTTVSQVEKKAMNLALDEVKVDNTHGISLIPITEIKLSHTFSSDTINRRLKGKSGERKDRSQGIGDARSRGHYW